MGRGVGSHVSAPVDLIEEEDEISQDAIYLDR